VTAATERGGAEVVIEQLMSRFDRARVDAVLAAPESGALFASWRANGWPVVALPSPVRLRRVDQGVRVIRALAHAIVKEGVDLVHTHGVAAQIYGGRAASRTHRPVLYHAHDLFERSWSADGLLHRLALRSRLDAVAAISETVAASLRHRVRDDRLHVIPNGVDDARVEPVRRPAPLVVWCGRLQRWKGAHLFLQAAARIHASRPDAHFAIVGGTLFGLEPGYSDALRRQADNAGIMDVVEWTGHVEDARPWLRAAAVVVHSSEGPEPFGLVMAEAMMQERPVAAFRQGGASEIVVDGETGMLVAPLDTGALADAVLGLLAEPERAQRMGAAGRERALARFNAGRMSDRVRALYEQIAGRAAAAMPEATVSS
jgi:glycosyltransferase involved in cell wall biosynthesis